MHLGDEEIQRVLHGELDAAARGTRLKHLEECTSCRSRVDEARRDEEEIFALLGHLDHPAPTVDAESVAGRARSGRSRGWMRKAALIAFALGGAGAAYAAPGSPLPGWIKGIAVALSPRSPALPSQPAPPEHHEAPAPVGIAVAPGRQFTIWFTTSQASGTATVRVTDGQEIVVRASNGTAAFATDVARLTITNEGSTADYDIELPRGAQSVDIRVAGRRLLLKEGLRIRTDASWSDTSLYALPLHLPSPQP